MALKHREEVLNQWKSRQSLAEKMIPMMGSLYRDKGVAVKVFGRRLMNSTTIDILKAHRVGRRVIGEELDIEATFAIVDAMNKMDLAPARVDIGKLAVAYAKLGGGSSVEDYLSKELAPVVGGDNQHESKDVVLYGFGRIGRLLARLLIERTGSGSNMRLRAIVVRGKGGDLEKRASLLRRDSIHGPFNGTITIDEERNAIIANGTFIQVIYANGPDQVDYNEFGIENALIVDNTGIWKDRDGLGLHLKSKGAAKVLLTAPAKGDIKNIVAGVNSQDVEPSDTILCAASCTTNAIVPVLKAVNDKFGIKNGHIETVHSYTNDQNLVDNMHSAERRGRSAPMNMVITSTGAAKAVAKALPELGGKLTGNAIRVPTPNVSMAVMNLNLDNSTTKEELNDFLCEKALGEMQGQIGFTLSTELVSTDLVGSEDAGVVDGAATIVDGDRVVLYVWYDNEAGYSNQVVRVMQKVVGLKMPEFPAL